MRNQGWLAVVIGGVFYTTCATVFSANSINDAIKEQNVYVSSSQKSQINISKLSSQTRQMLDEYKLVMHKIDNLKSYNSHLQTLITSQKEESIKISQQLGGIESTQQNISPLIIRMVNTLDDFVKIDIPFNQQERLSRVSSLKDIINRADISVSEKYRRVMEAYQLEVGYGKTLSSYQGKLKLAGKDMTVDFLRIGRVGYYYRTLDGESVGYWDINTKSWQILPDEFYDDINKGFKVALKHEAPDLLMTPVQFTKVVP